MCVHTVGVTTQLKILRLELAIIFIIDKSADYIHKCLTFLNEKIIKKVGNVNLIHGRLIIAALFTILV